MVAGVLMSAGANFDSVYSSEEVFVRIGAESIQIPSAVLSAKIVRLDQELPASVQSVPCWSSGIEPPERVSQQSGDIVQHYERTPAKETTSGG